MIRRISLGIAGACVVGALAGAALAHPDSRGRSHFKSPPMNPTAVMRALEGDGQPSQSLAPTTDMPCIGGVADIFPCSGVDLLSLTPLSDLPGGKANDIWGWASDAASGAREFALIGLDTGTAFVEVTTPTAPVLVGWLPTHTFNSSWRDIKVYADHAFIVSEASGHGMQVFDLQRLVDAAPADYPITFGDDGLYNGFGNAHNIAINEATGFAYVVGAATCAGGLHMIDISNPKVPVSPLGGQEACFAADGYTHDVQCVVYAGPDTLYQGREICFAANEDTLTIVDVTDKASPQQLSRVGYTGERYTHQAWLDETHTYLFLDDELDEQNLGHDTLTRVWDVSNLQAPAIIDLYSNINVKAIDHNQYVRDDLVYQANYRSGLRVLEIVRDNALGYAMLDEVGYFDVYPSSDSANFNGAWSNYPFLPSGNVLISGIEQGLFVVGLNLYADEISVLAPADGEMVFGPRNVDILAVDGDGGTPAVDWRIGGGAYEAASGIGGDVYRGAWDTTAAPEGVQTLTARMIDGTGDVTTSSIQVLINNQAPSVTFVSPAPGPVSGNVTLIADTDDDGSVVSVTFYDDGAVIGTDSNLSDGASVNWNTKRVASGAHVLSVTATDNRGQVSAPDTVTVDVAGKGGGGGGGGPKCFKNKEPLCDP